MYSSYGDLERRCFLQNLCASLHTYGVVGALFVVFASDHGLRESGLAPYYSAAAYADVAVSLGYFLFVLPWSLDMYVRRGARPPYTGLDMVFHHVVVVIAELAYLLTQAGAWYGAVALLLFELTNWFFLPHLLLTQLGRAGGVVWTVLGALLVLCFIACRIFAGTWLGMRLLVDVAGSASAGNSGGGGGGAIVLLLCFWAILLLSYFWLAARILPALHRRLQAVCGEEYHHAIVPRRVRVWATKLSPQARAMRVEQARRMQALREMQAELEQEEAPV